MSRERSSYTLQDHGDTFSLVTPPLSRSLGLAFAWALGIALVGATAFLTAGILSPGTLMPHWEWSLLLYVLVIAVVAVLCWLTASSLVGSQVIEFDRTAIRVRRVVKLGGRMLYVLPAALYPREKVTNLRIHPAINRSRRYDGPFAFDCAGRTVRFGGRLNERRIREIWAELQERFPQLTARPRDNT